MLPAVAGLAIVAAIGVGTAIALALHQGGTNSAGSGGNAGAAGATSPPVSATRVATQASASTSANPDACLVGTWKDIDQQVVDTSTGTPILFTGSGGMLTVNANGTFTGTYDNVILTAHSGGVDYTAQLNGTNSGTWAVNGGQLVVNDESSNITEALTKNGVYAGSGKLTTISISAAYTCSGNTVIETFAEGGGNHFVRVSSLPQAEEGPGSVS